MIIDNISTDVPMAHTNLSKNLKNLRPYLYNMKEFWILQNQMKDTMLATLPAKETIPSSNVSKQFLKAHVLQMLSKNKANSKLKLIMKNAQNNFKTDNNIIDNNAREKFDALAQKWPISLQTMVDLAFDNVAEVLRMHKKAK